MDSSERASRVDTRPYYNQDLKISTIPTLVVLLEKESAFQLSAKEASSKAYRG